MDHPLSFGITVRDREERSVDGQLEDEYVVGDLGK
jgi:hypothetical protein